MQKAGPLNGEVLLFDRLQVCSLRAAQCLLPQINALAALHAPKGGSGDTEQTVHLARCVFVAAFLMVDEDIVGASDLPCRLRQKLLTGAASANTQTGAQMVTCKKLCSLPGNGSMGISQRCMP